MNAFTRIASSVLLLTTLAGCQSVPAASSAAMPSVPVKQPTPVAYAMVDAVLWTQTAAESRGVSLQAYATARRMLDQALGDPSWTAATEQTGSFETLPPAIILDVDETVADNSSYQAGLIQSEEVFNEPKFSEWFRQGNAGAIAGSLAFTQYAMERGVTVFFVTNKPMTEEAATRALLVSLGFPIDETVDTVLLPGEDGSTSRDKSLRRAIVASRYRVLLLVGDDLNDFVSAPRHPVSERNAFAAKYDSYWGTKWILLANPMYGSWEGAVLWNDPSLKVEERMKRKLDSLDPKR